LPVSIGDSQSRQEGSVGDWFSSARDGRLGGQKADPLSPGIPIHLLKVYPNAVEKPAGTMKVIGPGYMTHQAARKHILSKLQSHHPALT
jgi:hypothetical protein